MKLRLPRWLGGTRRGGQDDRAREMAARAAARIERMRAVLERVPPPRPRGAARGGIPRLPAPLFFTSSVCTAEDFRHPEFHRWAAALREDVRYKRKLWEFVFICAHLEAAGLLAAPARGLGFGVGREKLPALFAARGCRITGTDQALDAAIAAGWAQSNQHAQGLGALNLDGLCPEPEFRERVAFSVCDMTRIDPALRGFDFCWSSCSLEHLGSIAAGAEFVRRSLDTLKPGGLAVHTTEYNLSSNERTLDDNPGTVIFRQRDIEALVASLAAEGHSVMPVDFECVTGPVDLFVDEPPYTSDVHLRLDLAGFVSTSIGLVIEKAR